MGHSTYTYGAPPSQRPSRFRSIFHISSFNLVCPFAHIDCCLGSSYIVFSRGFITKLLPPTINPVLSSWPLFSGLHLFTLFPGQFETVDNISQQPGWSSEDQVFKMVRLFMTSPPSRILIRCTGQPKRPPRCPSILEIKGTKSPFDAQDQPTHKSPIGNNRDPRHRLRF